MTDKEKSNLAKKMQSSEPVKIKTVKQKDEKKSKE